MKRAEEWDWPPTRRRRYYRTVDKCNCWLVRSSDTEPAHEYYQPSGWDSPVTKKAVRIYWRVTITLIKMLLAIPLLIIEIGAFWLLWTIITL
jgi:hypothetical protein